MDVSTIDKCFQRLRRHFESCLRHKMANGNGFDVRAEVYRRRTPSSRHKGKAFLFRSAVKKQCHCLARQGSRRWWSSNSTLKLLIPMVIWLECGGSAAVKLIVTYSWSRHHFQRPTLVQTCLGSPLRLRTTAKIYNLASLCGQSAACGKSAPLLTNFLHECLPSLL